MARPMIAYFPASDINYLYSLSVAGGAAGLVPLNFTYPIVFPGIARVISFRSTDNLAGMTFTVVGTDHLGRSVTEVVTGPNAATVSSTTAFNTISSITASGAYTNFSMGTGTTGRILWMPLNTNVTTFDYALSANIGGTIDYSLFQTLDPIGYYTTLAGTSWYNTSNFISLANNPLATVNGSAYVTVTVPTTSAFTNGQLVTISGAAITNNISAANLNITAAIQILSQTTFGYTAGGAANATGAGGGASIVVTSPIAPTQIAISAALTGAITSQYYATINPCSAISGVINSSTGGNLRLTIQQIGY